MILATFFLLFLTAAATPAPATPSVQKAPAGWENTMAVKDGKASKLRPKTLQCNFWNRQKSMILATFFLLFLTAAATPAPPTPSVQKAPAGWENTMVVKDGKGSKLRPKTP